MRGRLVTCYSPVRHSSPKWSVRLACIRHAASVHPEPGSNSPFKEDGETIYKFDSVYRFLLKGSTGLSSFNSCLRNYFISSLQYPVFKVLRAGFLRPVASATRESRKAVLSSRVGGASRGKLRKLDLSSQDVHISLILYINQDSNRPWFMAI